MPVTPIVDHVAQAVARLIEQYKKKPDLEGMVGAFTAPFQALEDTFQDLETDRSLETSVGVQLDRLGTIVGIARATNETDDEYRISIKTKIVENISQGEPERLITVYRLLVGASLVYLSELYPGGIGLMSDVDLADQDFINLLFKRIDRIAAAGVRIDYLGSFDPDEPFAMAGTLPGEGFGTDTDPLIGGKFATLYLDMSEEFAFAGNSLNAGGFGTILDPLVGGVFQGV